jgi:hypothetical protein
MSDKGRDIENGQVDINDEKCIAWSRPSRMDVSASQVQESTLENR